MLVPLRLQLTIARASRLDTENIMQSNSLAALVAAHKWYALAAIVVGFLIRILKDDTKLPTIPARVRPWISVAAGIVALALDKLAAGASWKIALVNGAIVGGLPIVAHQLGIESVLGGKEVPLPAALLAKEDGPKPPTGTPPALLVFMVLLFGCSALPSAEAPKRDLARASVLLMVQGVELADTICANLAAEAQGSKDVEKLKKASALAHKCADGKATALHGAEAARAALNAWEQGGDGQIGCAAKSVFDGLTSVTDALKSAGGAIPPALDDAIERARTFEPYVQGAVCNLWVVK